VWCQYPSGLILPYLSDELTTAVVGAPSWTFVKPTGDKIIIKGVFLSSNKNPTFVEVKSKLYDIHKTETKMMVVHEWAVSLEHWGKQVNVEWPKGWKLTLTFATQTADDTTKVVIAYDIIELPKKRPRWGE